MFGVFIAPASDEHKKMAKGTSGLVLLIKTSPVAARLAR
tara:strand:+ start:686 stop:802 length:117 start_codon:yes stop_codon:yes gene_type:complete